VSSNKEYRKYPNLEDASYKFSDIVYIIEDCKDRLRFVECVDEIPEEIKKIKKYLDEIEKLI
jgi:hypothetical protein